MSGIAVAPTVVEITGRPASAWLATACAIQ
jgi:hypothetical protein